MKLKHFPKFLKTSNMSIVLFSCKEEKNKTVITKPNIVFVITDDQGYGDLGHTGNTVIKTPVIDKMKILKKEF